MYASYSQISKWLGCPRAWWLDKIAKIPWSASVAMDIGTFNHNVAEAFHHNEPAPGEDRAAFIVSLMADALQNISEEHRADPKFTAAFTKSQQIWLPWYANWTASQQTQESEARFNVDLPTTDHTIAMVMDRVYEEDGQIIISDMKAGRNKPTGLATDLQLTIYAWGYQQIAGRLPDAVEIVHLPSQTVHRVGRTQKQIDVAIEHVIAPALRVMSFGQEDPLNFPCNPMTKFGCGYCDYAKCGACPVGAEMAADSPAEDAA